jgi:CBS domain-containing protein
VRVEEVMAPAARLITTTPQENLGAALTKMDDAGIAQMPVLEGERLVGLLSREQVLHYVRARAELGV